MDPARTRMLARDIRAAARTTDLSRLDVPLFDDAFPPTARFARSAAAALAAVTRRSAIISTHLGALSTDADTFVDSAVAGDGALQHSWEETL